MFMHHPQPLFRLLLPFTSNSRYNFPAKYVKIVQSSSRALNSQPPGWESHRTTSPAKFNIVSLSPFQLLWNLSVLSSESSLGINSVCQIKKGPHFATQNILKFIRSKGRELAFFSLFGGLDHFCKLWLWQTKWKLSAVVNHSARLISGYQNFFTAFCMTGDWAFSQHPK